MSERCCCGRFDSLTESMIINETQHEILGPARNFCGPTYKHELRDMKEQLDALELIIQKIVRDVCVGIMK